MKIQPTYWWSIIAKNEQTLATSEVYTTKAHRSKTANKFSTDTGIPIEG
jgi:uncharacterized protein YegP (UPF0339 family)